MNDLASTSGSAMSVVRALRASVAFMTIIPVPGSETRREELASAHYYFPITGLLIGSLLVIFLQLLQSFDATVLSILAVLFLAAITRGMHYDGLADAVDGLVGGADQAATLRIMKDSFIGAFGTLALIFAVTLKIAAFYLLIKAGMMALLLFVPLLSRTILAWIMVSFKYVGGSGLGSLFTGGSRASMTITSSLAVAAGVGIAIASQGLLGTDLLSSTFIIIEGAMVAMIIAAVISLLMCRVCDKKIGGLTGDVYGAIIEISEVVIALTFIQLIGVML